jgi:protein-disulfide isomerase
MCMASLVLLGQVPADCAPVNRRNIIVKRWILAGSVLAAGMFGSLAQAQSRAQTPVFTPAQRAAIVQILREALQQDPTILRDAVNALQAEDNASSARASSEAIAKFHTELLASPAGAVAGNPNGSVTVVEFYDTRCTYCRKMLPEIDALLHADHKVRWVYKDFPVLGPDSTIEAKALIAALRQNGYAKLQAVFLQQGGTETEDNIETLANSVGLNGKKLTADMHDPAVSAAIDANLALGGHLNIDGTPAFVIGDVLLPGAVELSDLTALVQAAEK